MQQMILDEAYGLVTVYEGGNEIEMPMNQAVFRAIGLAALKGSLSAQRRWAEMVQAAEVAQKRAGRDLQCGGARRQGTRQAAAPMG
jgi:hypothetical protein